MASRSRPRRGGGGARRGPPRGRGGYRRPQAARDFSDAQLLGKEEVECEGKTIVIEFKSNEQGQFMKVSEDNKRIILNMDSSAEMKGKLREFVEKKDELLSKQVNEGDIIDSAESFRQGMREYFVDIRVNNRGRFVKLIMLSGTYGNKRKSFVAFPLENLEDFEKIFARLHSKHYDPASNNTTTGPVSSTSAAAAPEVFEESSVSKAEPLRSDSPTNWPSSREVRAGGKSFFFDVDRNERGIYIRLTEVVKAGYGKRTHINIPNSCWPQMSEVFSQLSKELPFDDRSDSGSDEN